MVHRNLLLPLLSNPLDNAGELDNSRSLVDPKETMGTQVAIAVSAIATHMQNLSTYVGAQVTNLLPDVWILFVLRRNQWVKVPRQA